MLASSPAIARCRPGRLGTSGANRPPREPDEDVAFLAGYQEQIGGQLLLILLDDAARRGGVARLDRGLEAGQIRNQPSLAGKVLDADPAVLLDQASGLVEAAEELLFGLSW